ncbi:MAG: hypothetical protein AAB353_12125 [Candidatus Hydrogenedentota bacterium]
MKRGCLIGCLIVFGLFALMIVVVGFVADSMFNLFQPLPPVDLAAAYGTEHAIVFRMDMNNEQLREMAGKALDQGPGMLEFFWPHQLYFFMDANAEAKTRSLGFALSTRRMAKLWGWILPIPDEKDVGSGLVIQEISVDDNGVIQASADGPTREEDLATLASTWAAPFDVEPLALEGGHFMELVINNRNGEAFLAVAPWAEDIDWDEAAKSSFTKEHLDALHTGIATARVTGDMAGKETLQFEVLAIAPDDERAAKVAEALSALTALMAEDLKEHDSKVTFEALVEQQGSEVHATITMGEYGDVLVDRSKERIDEIEVQIGP